MRSDTGHGRRDDACRAPVSGVRTRVRWRARRHDRRRIRTSLRSRGSCGRRVPPVADDAGDFVHRLRAVSLLRRSRCVVRRLVWIRVIRVGGGRRRGLSWMRRQGVLIASSAGSGPRSWLDHILGPHDRWLELAELPFVEGADAGHRLGEPGQDEDQAHDQAEGIGQHGPALQLPLQGRHGTS